MFLIIWLLFNVFIIWKQDWAQCVGFHLLLFCCWRMLETGRVKWQLCSRFWTQKYPENLWENKIKHNTFTLMTCLMILIDLYQPLWISMIFHCWMTWNIVMMFVVEDLQGLTASLHFHLGFTMLPIDPIRQDKLFQFFVEWLGPKGFETYSFGKRRNFT